jgi:hypothetical protein
MTIFFAVGAQTQQQIGESRRGGDGVRLIAVIGEGAAVRRPGEADEGSEASGCRRRETRLVQTQRQSAGIARTRHRGRENAEPRHRVMQIDIEAVDANDHAADRRLRQEILEHGFARRFDHRAFGHRVAVDMREVMRHVFVGIDEVIAARLQTMAPFARAFGAARILGIEFHSFAECFHRAVRREKLQPLARHDILRVCIF